MDITVKEPKMIYNNAAEIDCNKLSDMDLYRLAETFYNIYMQKTEGK